MLKSQERKLSTAGLCMNIILSRSVQSYVHPAVNSDNQTDKQYDISLLLLIIIIILLLLLDYIIIAFQ